MTITREDSLAHRAISGVHVLEATPGDTTDGEAIAASIADPQRFGQVFDRHVDAIYGYLCRRVGRTNAEELTSETFARAFDGRERFSGEDALPWLYGIAAACFKVRVTNHGSTGDGTCTLLADFTTSNGDRSVEGPRLDVSGLASGARITKTLAWRTALPTGPDRSFRGLCSPGLSS